MRSFTVLYGLLYSLSLQAISTINVTPELLAKLGATECQSASVCRQKCGVLKSGTALCSTARQEYQGNGETGVTRQSFCSDWSTICETEELYIDRGTPNPAYNWELRQVKDRCWIKGSDPLCAPAVSAFKVSHYADCEISEVTVDTDFYLKPISCGGLCETLKKEKEVTCSTEGSHSGAPPSAWGHFYVGKDQLCIETRRASGAEGQACYELAPKPSIVRD